MTEHLAEPPVPLSPAANAAIERVRAAYAALGHALPRGRAADLVPRAVAFGAALEGLKTHGLWASNPWPLPPE